MEEFNQTYWQALIGSLSGGTPSLSLRAASASSFFPHNTNAVKVSTAVATDVYNRVPFVIGADIPGIVLSATTIILASNSGVTKNANGFTITKAAIEISGVTVPILFSGARSKVMSSGDNDIQTDELPASSFSLTKFAQGTTGFIRIQSSFAAGQTDTLPNTAQGGTGSSGYYVDPTKVNVTNGVDGTGIFTYSMINGGVNGTDAINAPGSFVPMLLGRHNSSAVAFLGDSKTNGTGDTATAYGATGMGRALLANPTLAAGARSGINFGCPNGVAADCATSVGGTPVSALTNYYKYCTHAVVGYGTNAQTQSAQTALHAQIRANSISQIIQISLTPRLSSCLVTLTSLTSSGTTATGAMTDTSGLVTGQSYPIAGATGATTAYNGTYAITVVDGTTFTYTFAGTSGAAATGTTTLNDQARTELYQIPNTGWVPGGSADVFEAFLRTTASNDPNMTYYQSMGERNGTTGNSYWRWKVNGTALYSTADYLHETAVGYELNVGTNGIATTGAGSSVNTTLRAILQALP